MLTPEAKNHLSLDELNRKADILLQNLKFFDPIVLKQNMSDFLDDLEVILPVGPGIVPRDFFAEGNKKAEDDQKEWKEIHRKLKEIGRLHPEGLSKRYYRLMVVIVLYAGVNGDFFSSKI